METGEFRCIYKGPGLGVFLLVASKMEEDGSHYVIGDYMSPGLKT